MISKKEHRPTTLVFAKDRNEAGIKEAMINHRTALWFENNIIGDKQFLDPLFHESVKVIKTEYLENLAVVTIKNDSGLNFIIENVGGYSFYNKTSFMEIEAGEEMILLVKTGKVLDQFNIKVSVKNLITAPNTYLTTNLICNKTGIIKDKKQVK